MPYIIKARIVLSIGSIIISTATLYSFCQSGSHFIGQLHLGCQSNNSTNNAGKSRSPEGLAE